MASVIGKINSRGMVEVVTFVSVPLSVQGKVNRAIERAAKEDIELTPECFTTEDGEIFIDGMDPKDWLYAMTMD